MITHKQYHIPTYIHVSICVFTFNTKYVMYDKQFHMQYVIHIQICEIRIFSMNIECLINK